MKFIKSTFFSLLILTFTFLSLHTAQNSAGPMGMPTEEELKMVQDFLNSIPPEEFAKLNALGEEIMKQAELKGEDPLEYAQKIGAQAQEAGEDPYEFLMKQKKAEAPKPQITTPVVTENERAAPTKPAVEPGAVDVTKIGQLRYVIDSILDIIQEVRQKSFADARAQQMIGKFNFLIDDVVYYLFQLKQEKLLKYVAQKEFSHLAQTLLYLENDLSYLRPYIEFPQFSLEGEDPYVLLGLNKAATDSQIVSAYEKSIAQHNLKAIEQQLIRRGVPAAERKTILEDEKKQYDDIVKAYTTIVTTRNAYQALDKVINALAQAAYASNVLADCKKLLKTYEPDALKIKEEQEKLEAAARKDQEEAAKRRPPFSIPAFDSSFLSLDRRGGDFDRGNGRRSNGAGGSSLAGGTSSEAGGLTGPKFGGAGEKAGAAGANGKDKTKPGEIDKAEKDKEKDKDKEKKPINPKVTDRLKEIEKQLKELADYMQNPLGGADENAEEPKKLLQNFFIYLNTEYPRPLTSSEAKKELSKSKLINNALMFIANKLSAIKNGVAITIGLTKADKIILKNQAKRLFDLYRENYFKELAEAASLAAVSEDNKSIITDAGATKPMAPGKQFAHMGVGLDDPASEVNNPVNSDLKSINREGNQYLRMFIDANTALKDAFK